MPIVIPRNGSIPGSVKDTYTQEQKNRAWEIIFQINAEKILGKMKTEIEKEKEPE